MTTRRLSVLAAILALAGVAASSVAGIPDPSLSTVPNVIASPGGSIPYNVTIVGQGGSLRANEKLDALRTRRCRCGRSVTTGSSIRTPISSCSSARLTWMNVFWDMRSPLACKKVSRRLARFQVVEKL